MKPYEIYELEPQDDLKERDLDIESLEWDILARVKHKIKNK